MVDDKFDRQYLNFGQNIGIDPATANRYPIEFPVGSPYATSGCVPNNPHDICGLRGCLVKPVLQALILAEKVYQDITGKKIIAGTFNVVCFCKSSGVRQFELPDGSKRTRVAGGLHGGSPFAYISLTDIFHQTTLLLQFVNLTENQVIFSSEVTVESGDRLETVELAVPLPLLPIDEEGIYAFEVVCENEILGSCRIAGKEVTLTYGPEEE